MYAKFEYYNFSAGPVARKETKLQKYLRLKNEHILEKCFDIKKASRETSPAPSSRTNPMPQIDESITLLTAKTEDEVFLPAADCQQDTTANESEVFFETEASNKKSVKVAKNANNSKQSFNSKTVKTIQSKCKAAASHWKSPFKTFITNGLRSRPQSSEFAYDLSRDELKFAGQFSRPMKPAADSERQLLQHGQRRDYLKQRYEHAPVVKYNYPEATSWRIGWLQQQP